MLGPAGMAITRGHLWFLVHEHNMPVLWRKIDIIPIFLTSMINRQLGFQPCEEEELNRLAPNQFYWMGSRRKLRGVWVEGENGSSFLPPSLSHLPPFSFLTITL